MVVSWSVEWAIIAEFDVNFEHPFLLVIPDGKFRTGKLEMIKQTLTIIATFRSIVLHTSAILVQHTGSFRRVCSDVRIAYITQSQLATSSSRDRRREVLLMSSAYNLCKYTYHIHRIIYPYTISLLYRNLRLINSIFFGIY